MQRIFSSAGAFSKDFGVHVRWRAPGELKISCTKPRAYGGAMGIESAGDENRCVLGKVGVEERCAVLGVDRLRWCSSRRQGRAA